MHPNKRRRDGRWEDYSRGRDRYSSEYVERRPHARRPPIAWVPPVRDTNTTQTSASLPLPGNKSHSGSADSTTNPREEGLLVHQQPSIVTATSSSSVSVPPTRNEDNHHHHHADHIGKVTPDLMDDESEQYSAFNNSSSHNHNKRKRDDFVPDIVRATHTMHHSNVVLSPATSPMIHYHETKAAFNRETSVEEGEIPTSPTIQARLEPTEHTREDPTIQRKKKQITLDDDDIQHTTTTAWSHDRDDAELVPTSTSPASYLRETKVPADAPRKKSSSTKSSSNHDRVETVERPKKKNPSVKKKGSSLPKPSKTADLTKKTKKSADGKSIVLKKLSSRKQSGVKVDAKAERPTKSREFAPQPVSKKIDGERTSKTKPLKKPKKQSSETVTDQGKGPRGDAPRPKAKSVKVTQPGPKTKDSAKVASLKETKVELKVISDSKIAPPKLRKTKKEQPSAVSFDGTLTAETLYDSSWVAESMIARHESDSDTDDEELLVWAHHKLGVHIPDRAAVDRKRRKKLQQRRRARREAAAKERKEQAKPLTQVQIAALLAADEGNASAQDGATCWVRRSMRQPCRSALQAPGVKELIAKLAANDPDMVVLKMKKYCSDCDTPQLVIDSVLDALEENTNCEALYIQNFNEGMRDDQLLHLLRILRNPRCKIWCLNIGETYNVSTPMWERFARGLRKTKVTHMYASEHVISTELKDTIRETIRRNRQKHTMHCDPANLDTIVRCTHCWWNPINTKSLRPHVRKYEHILKDADAQGLRGTMTGATLK